MALLKPFLSHTFKTLHSSLPLPHKPGRTTISIVSLQPPFKLYHQLRRVKKQWKKWHAMAEVGGETVVEGEGLKDDQSVSSKSVLGKTRAERVVVDYDWTDEWYPLYLTQNVPDDAPLGLTVFDKRVVLYRDGKGQLLCCEDRCPHRLAKLSEGQLVDGRLECLYHGWQFEGDGKCVRIPQLPANAMIPQSACLRTYEAGISRHFNYT